MLICFTRFSLNKLYDLNNGNDNESESDCDEIFNDAYACKAECVCKERNLTYESGCNERADACKPKDLIMRAELKYASSLRAHIEAMEDLCHGHG